MQLCLIRHGETEFNVAGRLQGGLPASLTAEGSAAAERLGALLRQRGPAPRRLICSPTFRARQTIERMRMMASEPHDPDKCGAVAFDDAFRARSFGALEGFTRAECDERWPGAMATINTWDDRPPGDSESQQQVAARASARLTQLFAETGLDDLVLVVTHHEVIVGLTRVWSGVYPPAPPPIKVANTSACFFAWTSLAAAPVLIDTVVA